MNIDFILNGEDVSVNTRAVERLSTILHDNFEALSVKTGCLSGHCGSCLVIMNGKLVNSCLIPAFKARKSEIITLEGFELTEEYRDILHGFQKAGVETCGFCLSGKILSAEATMDVMGENDRDSIVQGMAGCACRCTEHSALIRGVELAMEKRRERKYGIER